MGGEGSRGSIKRTCQTMWPFKLCAGTTDFEQSQMVRRIHNDRKQHAREKSCKTL